MLSQKLHSLQVMLLNSNGHIWFVLWDECLYYVLCWVDYRWELSRQRCWLMLILSANKYSLCTIFKYIFSAPPWCSSVTPIPRLSYHSGTLTLSCSGPPCRAATRETSFWSRRNSELWPCREKNWPTFRDCSPSIDRSSSAGRERGKGTASKWRPLRLGCDRERRSADGRRWSVFLSCLWDRL